MKGSCEYFPGTDLYVQRNSAHCYSNFHLFQFLFEKCKVTIRVDYVSNNINELLLK
jgi:hypothetical protein